MIYGCDTLPDSGFCGPTDYDDDDGGGGAAVLMKMLVDNTREGARFERYKFCRRRHSADRTVVLNVA